MQTFLQMNKRVVTANAVILLFVTCLKAGYKNSDQTSWRLKTKHWIWLIGNAWFDQHWSSSGYNSDFLEFTTLWS